MKEFLYDFIKKFWWFIAAVIVLPFLFKIPAFISWMDFSNSESSANAMNGFTTPIIGFTSVILLYKAFSKQQETIDLQQKTIELQEKTNEIQHNANLFQETINKNLKIENKLNFLLSEFNRLETKIFEVSKIYKNFNDYALGLNYNESDFIYNLNKINYSILTFNNLINISEINKIEERYASNNKIDYYDEIILNNLNSLYSIVLNDTLKKIGSFLAIMVRSNITEESIHTIEFTAEYKKLETSMGLIKDILNRRYPNFNNN